jgi:hypothetical protein
MKNYNLCPKKFEKHFMLNNLKEVMICLDLLIIFTFKYDRPPRIRLLEEFIPICANCK